jgi:hypothetical protein
MLHIRHQSTSAIRNFDRLLTGFLFAIGEYPMIDNRWSFLLHQNTIADHCQNRP